MGTLLFAQADVAAMVAANIASLDLNIKIVNCVEGKGQQIIRFKIINTELGPTVQQSPKSIVVSTASGVRPPKLVNLVQYYYSNCAVTAPKITETVTIEVADSAGVWSTSSITVINGDFDSTKLNVSLPYRVKIVGMAPTGSMTQSVYIQIVILVPPPMIDPQFVMFPMQIVQNQTLLVSVPLRAIKCQGPCKSVIFTCSIGGAPCLNAAGQLISITPQSDAIFTNLTVPSATFTSGVIVFIGVTATDSINQISSQFFKIQVLAAGASVPIPTIIQGPNKYINPTKGFSIQCKTMDTTLTDVLYTLNLFVNGED